MTKEDGEFNVGFSPKDCSKGPQSYSSKIVIYKLQSTFGSVYMNFLIKES